MIPYGFHPEARSELHESARYYEFQKCGLGYRFVDAVRDAIQRIRSHPLLYREVEQGFRQCRVVRFPFGIIYRFNKERVEIIAVMHLRRKPGYWKERQTGR